ncbi:SNARE associated Golgi protein, partial [Aphelenchoides avenae]
VSIVRHSGLHLPDNSLRLPLSVSRGAGARLRVLSACGAAVCCYLSYTIGRKLVMYYFPERIAKWQSEVAWQGDDLFDYMVFLRVTPILPNWFINIASPVIDVPLAPFFFGTAAGVAPPSFLYVQAGTTLQMMTSAGAVWSRSTVAILLFFAVLSLLPLFYKHLKKKTD